MKRLAPLLAALALSACGGLTTDTPPTLLLLPDPPPPATPAPRGGPSVAVSRVSLPEYADAAGVATARPDGGAEQSLDYVWADAPSRALTLALARALADRTGGAALAEPWPPEFAPDLRVDVIVERLIADGEGAARLVGEFRVADARGPLLARAERFDIAAQGAGEGYVAIADAHAQAVAVLADRIAAAIR
jgi:uncharacterized lipoprotein YmbA